MGHATRCRPRRGWSAAPDAAEDDAASDEDLPPPLPEQLGQLSIDQRKQEDDEREKKREKRAAQRLKILAEVLASESLAELVQDERWLVSMRNWRPIDVTDVR